jgi:NAD(P)-dependent dehydrogenase (short-subunit alcohol dehydrogenase family)
MIDTGLKNKVVLITGVNNPHGIGAATAKAFTAEGARVSVTYLRQLTQESTTNVPSEPFFREKKPKLPMKLSPQFVNTAAAQPLSANRRCVLA